MIMMVNDIGNVPLSSPRGNNPRHPVELFLLTKKVNDIGNVPLSALEGDAFRFAGEEGDNEGHHDEDACKNGEHERETVLAAE